MNIKDAKEKFIAAKIAAGITKEKAEILWKSSQERFDLYDNKRLNVRRGDYEEKIPNSSESSWDDFHFDDL